MAQALEATDAVDFINVAVGTYYNLHLIMPSMHIPFGFKIDVAEQIKNGVGIPVMVGYQIGFPGKADWRVAQSSRRVICSAMCSAWRMAKATIVRVGFSQVLVVNWLPSEINRLSMS